MTVVNDKYRGKTTYFHVMTELIQAARYHGTTTYQDIAVIMGITVTGNLMGKETGQILGEISEDEVLAGRPMLSAVAVNVNGVPTQGFFALARQLGLLKNGEDEHRFWERQKDAIYKVWKRPMPVRAAGAAG